MAKKNLKFNSDARQKIKKGVDKLAKAVKSTLGPRGRNVVIEQSYGSPTTTKDGVSVAKEVNLKNPVENMGAQMVKEVAIQANDQAGDGTTTAIVLAQSIVNHGFDAVSDGINPVELKRGIDKAVSYVSSKLTEISKEVVSSEEVAQVGTISANNDPEIGGLLSTAMEKVGKEGVITVEEGNTSETTLEVVEGMQFGRGYISPYFITNKTSMKVELDDPYILLYDKKITALNDVMKILETAVQQNRSMLIVAEDIEGEALATLVVNNLRGTFQVCAVKAPEFGEKRKAMLEDIATLTGATVISSDRGMKLAEATTEHLGTCKRIVVDNKTTTVVDGAGEETAIAARVETVKSEIENATSDYDKEKLQERLAKLSGGVAVIKIGAESELEMKEKKDRLDDALNATKAAVEEGVVPGGGTALLKIGNSLERMLKVINQDDIVLDNDEQRLGANIVVSACYAPFKAIMKNAGLDSQEISAKLPKAKLDSDGTNVGFDARNEVVTDMFEAGIIDPTKVTRTALQKAASVAGLILTTECVITNIPEDDTDAGMPQQGMPPMM